MQAAVHWIKIAAEGGLVPAQLEYGSIFQYGRGLLKNDEEAFKWYEIAARRAEGVNRERAIAQRYKVAQHLTPAKIQKATNSADLWMQQHAPAFEGHYSLTHQ